MYTEIVTFRIGENMSRSDVVALYEKSVPTWKANRDLLHKSFLFDEESGTCGGVYLWRSMDAAREAHGEAFCSRIGAIFGSAPEFRYFESPVVINNYAGAEAESAA